MWFGRLTVLCSNWRYGSFPPAGALRLPKLIIGPGLLVGSGNVLNLAGPAGILVSFALVGVIVFFVMYTKQVYCLFEIPLRLLICRYQGNHPASSSQSPAPSPNMLDVLQTTLWHSHSAGVTSIPESLFLQTNITPSLLW